MMQKKIVKCQKCGTEYEMPPIAENVVMEDCPVCQDLDRKMKEIL